MVIAGMVYISTLDKISLGEWGWLWTFGLFAEMVQMSNVPKQSTTSAISPLCYELPSELPLPLTPRIFHSIALFLPLLVHD